MRARITAITTLTAALALSLTGCGGQDDTKPAPSASSETASPTPDVVDQLIEWRDGGGSETLDTFLQDLTAVDKASDPVDPDGLRDACADLAAHVETAQLEDPIPDKTANNSWKLALEHFAASATACTNGAVSESQDDFDLMASEMDIGIRHMTAVSDRLGELAPQMTSPLGRRTLGNGYLSVDDLGISLRRRIAYTETSLPSPIAARPYTTPPAPQPAATSHPPAGPGRPPAWWEQKQATSRP